MVTTSSPTARALRMLEMLRAADVVSGSRLAEALGVTERAVRRYVEILREAGVDVTSTRGPYGGYRLGRGTRLPPVVFSEADALALVMAVLGSHPPAHQSGEPSGDGDRVGHALATVVRALPPRAGRQATRLWEHAATVPDARRARTDPETTSSLVGYSAERRRVRLAYRSEAVGGGRRRQTRGRWWRVTGGGTCCATPTAPTRSAPTGSTASWRSTGRSSPSSHPPT